MIPRFRLNFALLVIVESLLLTACHREEDDKPEPPTPDVTILVSGELVHGTIYGGPATQTDRHQATYIGGHITIYSNDLVIITDRDGIKHAAPFEWCSDLVYK